jgi:hypothetical protein
MATATGITITQVVHDLQARASYVTLVWDGRPEKRLGLPIPFGTKLEDIESEAQKAIQAFRSELASLSVKRPP